MLPKDYVPCNFNYIYTEIKLAMKAPRFLFYVFLVASLSGYKAISVRSGASTETFSKPQQKLSLKVSPNPFQSGKLYLQSNFNTPKHIEIFNVFGEKVADISTLEDAIELNDLKKGIYLLRLNQSGESITQRLIVQ